VIIALVRLAAACNASTSFARLTFSQVNTNLIGRYEGVTSRLMTVYAIHGLLFACFLLGERTDARLEEGCD